MDMETGDIVGLLRACLPEVLVGGPVALAYLHGSAARGQMTLGSDIDIALVVNGALPPYERLIMELDIETALAVRYKLAYCDVRVMNDAPLVFRGKVVTEGVLLFSRDEEFRIEYEMRTQDMYFDFLPAHREHQAAFFARLRERGLSG